MQDIFLILPLIIVALGSLFALLLAAYGDSKLSFFSALLSLVVALVCSIKLIPQTEPAKIIMGGFLYFDSLAVVSVAVIIFGTIASLLFAYNQIKQEGVDLRSEFYVLLLLSSLGASVLAMAANVAVFFISLEIMSLALYCLCGSAIWKEKSSEAALKYFIMGSFSSAVMLYGFSLVFALTGELGFADIARKLPTLDSDLFLFALALTSVGILLKLSAFPFHFWTADVYQGAPTAVTAFMASVVKVASFCAAIRVFWLVFGSSVAFWSEFMPFIAVATMTVGTLMALRQTDVKRMLAFSSVAHSGYLMVGLLSGASESHGIAALLFYLVLYLIMTLGAFDVVGALISEKGNSKITVLNGFAKTRPVAALLLSFFLLCLAGLPPGVAGLIAKIQLFTAAVRADYAWVVVVALINSAVGCYYYLKLIKTMYASELREKDEVNSSVDTPGLALGSFTVAAFCALTLLYFSVIPGDLMTFCRKLAELG